MSDSHDYTAANQWLLQTIQRSNWVNPTILNKVAETAKPDINLLDLLKTHGLLSTSQIQQLAPRYQDLKAKSAVVQRSRRSTQYRLSPNQIGDYIIESELGRGAAGVVYKVRKANEVYALKVLINATPEQQQRFLAEAEALKRIDHPNVVQIHEHGQSNGKTFMVMDFVQGCSLDQLLTNRGRLSESEANSLILDVASGLAQAHRIGVLHRDIKPANILIDEQGVEPRAILTDFGLAKFTQSQAESLTQTGEMIGTPAYMPPEQLGGSRAEISAQSDIYSIGASYYEMITGERLYDSNSMVELVGRILAGNWQSPRALNPELSQKAVRICERCLARSPRKRFKSVDELIEALSHDNPKPGRSTLWIIIGVIFACVLLFAATLSHDSKSTTPAITEFIVQFKHDSNPINLLIRSKDKKRQWTQSSTKEIRLKPGKYSISSKGYTIEPSEIQVKESPLIRQLFSLKIKSIPAKVKIFTDSNLTEVVSSFKSNSLLSARMSSKRELNLEGGQLTISFKNIHAYPRTIGLEIEPGREYHIYDRLHPRLLKMGQLSTPIVRQSMSTDSDYNGIHDLFLIDKTGGVSQLDFGQAGIMPSIFSSQHKVVSCLGLLPPGPVAHQQYLFHSLDNTLLRYYPATGEPRTLSNQSPLYPTSAFLDVDKDGFPDFVAVERTGKLRLVLRDQPVVRTRNHSRIAAPVSFALVDLENDGTNEVLALDEKGDLFAFRQNGENVFARHRNGALFCFAGNFILDSPGSELVILQKSKANETFAVAVDFRKKRNLVAFNIADTALEAQVVKAAHPNQPDQLAILEKTNDKVSFLNFDSKLQIYSMSRSTIKSRNLVALKNPPKSNEQMAFIAVSRGSEILVINDKQQSAKLTWKNPVQWMTDTDVDSDGLSDLLIQDSEGSVLAMTPFRIRGIFHMPVRLPRQIIQQIPMSSESIGPFIMTSFGLLINVFTGTSDQLVPVRSARPAQFSFNRARPELIYANGQKIYRHILSHAIQNEPDQHIASSASPIVRLFENAQGTLIAAEDRTIRLIKDQRQLWKTKLEGYCCAPITTNQKQYLIATNQSMIYLIDHDSGQILSKAQLPGSIPYSLVRLSPKSSRFFFTTQNGVYGQLVIQNDNVNVNYQGQFSGTPVANPIAIHNSERKITQIAIAAHDAVLGLAPNNGEIKWAYTNRRAIPLGGLSAVDLDNDENEECIALYWSKLVTASARCLNQQGELVLNVPQTGTRSVLSDHILTDDSAPKQAWVTGEVVTDIKSTPRRLKPRLRPIRYIADHWKAFLIGASKPLLAQMRQENQPTTQERALLLALCEAEQGNTSKLNKFISSMKAKDFRRFVRRTSRYSSHTALARARLGTVLQRDCSEQDREKHDIRSHNIPLKPGKTILGLYLTKRTQGFKSPVTAFKAKTLGYSVLPKAKRVDPANGVYLAPDSVLRLDFIMAQSATVNVRIKAHGSSTAKQSHVSVRLGCNGDDVRSLLLPKFPSPEATEVRSIKLKAGPNSLTFNASAHNVGSVMIDSVELVQVTPRKSR